MSIQHMRCPCYGNVDCKLCNGQAFYDYEVGPRGWLPFTCPTCEGAASPTCITCAGAGSIDPALPPPAPGMVGWMGKIWKIFMGG